MTTLASALRQLQSAGCIITGDYRGDHATRTAEHGHSGGWDHPTGHLPWVVVSQTPCLREDLGVPEPALDNRIGAVQTHLCRLKHVHAGSRALVPGAPPIREPPMKPPFAYYGGKTTLAERIVSLLPPHEHYVEPFAGSLAVLLAKQKSPLETVNDLDEQIMCFWRVLRDRVGDLEDACALTPHSRAEYTAAYEPVPDDHPDPDLERARRVWTVLTQGRAGTLRPTGWRHHITAASATGCPVPSHMAGYRRRMTTAADRLRTVSLECRPALEVIASYGRHPGVLLYVDPPYLAATRSSAAHYRHEMPHEDQHRELAEALHRVAAAVVLSGYASPLYDDIYGDWHRTELAMFTTQGGSRGSRTEVLWSNRPFPVADEALFTLESAR